MKTIQINDKQAGQLKYIINMMNLDCQHEEERITEEMAVNEAMDMGMNRMFDEYQPNVGWEWKRRRRR